MEQIFRRVVLALRGMWRFRWLGVVTAWLVAIVAFVVVSQVPERYEALARLFVNTDSILKPLMTGITVQPNDDQRILMLSRVMISRPNIEQLVTEVQLDAGATSAEQRAAVVDRTMKRLQLRGVGREGHATNLYYLSFQDENRARAKRAVELLADMFMDQSRGGKSADTESAKRFIDEQIALYDGKLREAEDRLKDFRTENLGM